jgi:hypothetical protein
MVSVPFNFTAFRSTRFSTRSSTIDILCLHVTAIRAFSHRSGFRCTTSMRTSSGPTTNEIFMF